MSEAGLLADPAEVRAILVASAKAGEAISYSETLALLENHGHRYEVAHWFSWPDVSTCMIHTHRGARPGSLSHL